MTDFFNFKFIAILVFIIGIIACFCGIFYSLKKGKLPKILYNYFCLIPTCIFTICLIFALIKNQIKFTSFLLMVFLGNFTFLLIYIFYLFIPKKIYKGIELSSQEEWLNLSYLLSLIEKVSRFELSPLEQDFFICFKEKIYRMTTYNCYEVPSSFELNRFYFICKRLQIS